MELQVLNAAEALLSARLAERIEIDQQRTLEDSLLDAESDLERHRDASGRRDEIRRSDRAADDARRHAEGSGCVGVPGLELQALVREMDPKSRYILEVVVSQLDAGVGRFRFPREVLLG
jgi:hypothetical protein